MAAIDTFKQFWAKIAAPAPKLRASQMGDELSAPGAIYDRPPYEGHLAWGINPERLGSIIREADGGSIRQWMILAEEIEERFPHYSAVLAKRRRQVAQLPVTVDAAGDDAEQQKHADLVRDWLDTGVLAAALYDVLDAIGKSFSVCEILWDTTPAHFWPARLAYRPTRWFEVNWLDGEQIVLRDGGGYVELARHKFLVHRHLSKSGGLVRGGMTRLVAFLWMYSAFTLRDWAIFCQGYGLPLRLGRYGPEASENDKRVLWRAVSSIAGDVAAIIPKSMEMEFPKDFDRAAGTKLYLDRADWLNREVSKLVLGSTAGTEAIAGGHAVGKEHRQVEEDVERFDAGLLATTLTRQIVPPMIDFTFGPPADGRYPVIRIGRPDEVPLQIWGPLVTGFAAAGLKFKAEEIYSRLQTSKPQEGDDLFGGAQAGDLENPAEAKDVPPVKTVPNVNPLATQSQRAASTKWLAGLITARQSADPDQDDVVALMSERLADEAGDALGGLTDAIRAEFEAATSLHDLAERLSKLDLDDEDLGDVMTRALALSDLVGRAAVVNEMNRQH